MKKILAFLEKNKYIAAFIKHYTSSEMDMSSIAVAYYLLLTTFPLLIILANAFPYLRIDINQLLKFLQDYLPQQLFGPTRNVILNIFSESSSSILGLAILVAIWTMSRSLTHLQRGVNKAYNASNHRDFFIGNVVGLIVSVLVLFLIAFAFFISSFATVVLQNLAKHYELSRTLYTIASNVVQPIMFVILVLGVALMYWVLPNVRIKKIRYIAPGTLFTTLVIYFLSDFIAAYVNRQLGRMIDFKFFGSVILFIMMLWFIFLARILMVGSVLNATYQDLHTKGNFESRRGDIISVLDRYNKWKAKRLKKKNNKK